MNIYLLILLLATALQMIAVSGFSRLTGPVVIAIPPKVTWICLITSLLLVSVLIWRRWQSGKSEKLNRIKFLMVFMLASGVAIYCVITFFAPTIPSFLCNLDGVVIFSVIAMSAAAAVTEELVFRGIMLQALHKRFGSIVAVILSAAIFTLAHGRISIAIFLGSIIYGYSAIATRSLIGAISAHFLNDVFMVFAGIVIINHNKLDEAAWVGFGLAVFVLIFAFDLLLVFVSMVFRINPPNLSGATSYALSEPERTTEILLPIQESAQPPG